MGKQDIRKEMQDGTLTAPVIMSYIRAPRLHQSTARLWPLLMRISGALKEGEDKRNKERHGMNEWREKRTAHQPFFCAAVFLLWPNWHRRPQIRLQLTWLMESLTSMNCSVWTFKRPHRWKHDFFLLFKVKFKLLNKTKLPSSLHRPFIWEKYAKTGCLEIFMFVQH